MAAQAAEFPAWLAAALRACALPEPWEIRSAPSGGCINRALVVRTGAGPVLVKSHAAAPPDFFLREREGLEALARAGSPLRVPGVIGLHAPEQGAAALVLEYLEPRDPDDATWEALGTGLAELHRNTGPGFGFAADNYLGATLQPNGWLESWPRFFTERRAGYMAGLLYRAGELPVEALRIHGRLLERIPQLLAHDPPPSLVHGDLWSGNFLPSAAGPALIDPAVHYADRETDLAMMRLFGGFPERVFEAYRAAWPLPGGWREREPLYQLFHLLNHHLLFGGSYGDRALAIAASLLGR